MLKLKNNSMALNAQVPLPPLKKQQGVVLIIALIVLIAMSLAGVALVRSVDTTNLIAGNIAFKQGALQEGNLAIEGAINQFAIGGDLLVIEANLARIENGYPTRNYSASILPANAQGIPLTLVNATTDFDSNANFLAKGVALDPLTNNFSRFVIERLCQNPGAFDEDTCRHIEAPTALDERLKGLVTSIPLFRITARMDGPNNNTVSYTQAIISGSTIPNQ
jgi:type IV pilus assembly protein PilX